MRNLGEKLPIEFLEQHLRNFINWVSISDLRYAEGYDRISMYMNNSPEFKNRWRDDSPVANRVYAFIEDSVFIDGDGRFCSILD